MCSFSQTNFMIKSPFNSIHFQLHPLIILYFLQKIFISHVYVPTCTLICSLSDQFENVTNKTGRNNEYTLVIKTIASTPQFTFILYNHNNTWHHLTLAFFSFHDITPSKVVLLVFRTNFNTEDASLRSVWCCHKPHMYARNNLWPQIAPDKTACCFGAQINMNCSSSTTQD